MPAAVAGILQAAQTDYNNALAALKAGNLSQFQTDVQAMDQQIMQAQQVLSATGTRHHDDDDHDDDGAAGQGGEGPEEDAATTLDDVLDHHHGVDEHRAQGRHVDDHLDDAGLGLGLGLGSGRRLRLRSAGRRSTRPRLRPGPGGPMMSGAKAATKGRLDGTARQGQGQGDAGH